MRKRIYAAALAAALALPAAGRAETLFAELGGHMGLARIVDEATVVWLKDPQVGPTFEDTNMDRFKRLLVEQLCHLTGGGCVYKGQDMRKAHKGLHLTTRQFNALAEDLQTAMDGLGIANSTQNRLIALLAPMHREVVTR